MVVSVIDIGTNTVLLLVAEVSSTGALTSLAEEQRIPRLGRGVDAQKMLHAIYARRRCCVRYQRCPGRTQQG